MKSSFGDGNELETLSLMVMAALNLIGNWNYLNSKSKFVEILEMNKFSFLSAPVGIVTSMTVTWYLLHNFRGLKSWESWWASQFLVEACKEEHQLIEECWGIATMMFKTLLTCRAELSQIPTAGTLQLSFIGSFFRARIPYSQSHR